jgi:hypothetical protein
VTFDDFFLSFLATLGGVFVAFFLTLEYDRRRKATQEKEDQKRVITAINLELQVNLKELDTFRQGFNERSIPLLLFRRAAYQSAIDEGTFSMLNPKLQVALAKHYDIGFRWVETVGAKLMSMLGTETAFQNWPKYKDRVVQMFSDGMSELHGEIPQTQKLLKDELTRLG